MSELSDITKEARKQMDSAIESVRRELSSIRTGKASPSLLDLVRVDAYGQTMPINQVASVSAPEPRLLTVQPFDISIMASIEKAIREADLGLNPANDGKIIRVPIPALNEERRKEMVKLVRKFAEDGKISIRHARTEALNKVKKVEHVSDDEKRHEEKEIQKVHDDAVSTVDDIVKSKEAEVMEV